MSIVDDLLEAASTTDTFKFHIERDPHRIQPGRTLSREAMDETFRLMAAWVEARMMERWETTGEPPTVVDVAVTVKVQ